jgi:hypothetical protein
MACFRLQICTQILVLILNQSSTSFGNGNMTFRIQTHQKNSFGVLGCWGADLNTWGAGVPAWLCLLLVSVWEERLEPAPPICSPPRSLPSEERRRDERRVSDGTRWNRPVVESSAGQVKSRQYGRGRASNLWRDGWTRTRTSHWKIYIRPLSLH